MRLIVRNNIRVNFYHIKGHVNIKKRDSIDNAMNVFNNSNNCSVSIDRIHALSGMNNLIDNVTRQILQNFKNEPLERMRYDVVNPILSNEEINRYYNLVTLGGNKL